MQRSGLPLAYSRQLRNNPTEVEKRLWMRIRLRQLGCKFRRQVPLGLYIVDFACLERKLIIELDGGQHDARAAYDAKRTAWLEARGWRVLRFWNNEVIENIEGVPERIVIELGGPSRTPPPLAGEGRVGDLAAAPQPADIAQNPRIPHLDPPPQAGEGA